jgi:hypothetical protein
MAWELDVKLRWSERPRMFHWREEYFKTLREVAAEAAAVPEWAEYATFCTEYEKGLRQQAFTTLDGLIHRLERAPFVERKRFLVWLLPRAEGRRGRHMLIPHPLQLRIVEPTLLEWTMVDPNSSEPHRWIGDEEHLRLSIKLDPLDDAARQKLVMRLLSKVGTYELPERYVGSPDEDLEALKEADEILQAVSSPSAREELSSYVADERRLIEDYLRRRRE